MNIIVIVIVIIIIITVEVSSGENVQNQQTDCMSRERLHGFMRKMNKRCPSELSEFPSPKRLK
jgi:hypothetical protein